MFLFRALVSFATHHNIPIIIASCEKNVNGDACSFLRNVSVGLYFFSPVRITKFSAYHVRK